MPAARWPAFGELVAAAARPIDDVRGSAAYRRHALAVLARRTLELGLERRSARMRVTCTVNGERREADDVWPGESLLYVLRERLGLPGAKNACEQGECGSCTVYLDGHAGVRLPGRRPARPRAATVRHRRGAGRRRASCDPVQEAFVEAGAVQCGFCTPGLIVAAHDLLRPQPEPDATRRSARRWPATCAAAPATRRSSTRSGWRPRAR